MPIVRTFAPIVAGVGHMNRGRFMFFNLLGGTIWVFGLGSLGYFLGSLIPDVDKYLLPIVGVIILLSILPPIMHIIKESDKTAKEHSLDLLKRVKYWVWSFFPTKEE